jgi:ComF family protein
MPTPYLTRLLNLLFPPRCPSCREDVAAPGALCGVCWKALSFIAAPMCAICGHPFEFSLGEQAECGECMRRKPAYAKARAVLRYDEHSSRPITGFKFSDRTVLAPMFGDWLARAGAEFLPRADALVPVPLHWRRLLWRRYNQSALLAHAVSRKTGLTVLPDILTRRKRVKPQAGLTRRQRLINMRGVFAVHPRRKASIAGKRLVLIDDVITTGATLNHCAKALLKAGASEVYVLTLAKTVLG